MLTFSRVFHDEKERKLQEAGARFAGTGAHPASSAYGWYLMLWLSGACRHASMSGGSSFTLLLCFCRRFGAGRSAGGAGRGSSACHCTAGADLRFCSGASQ